MSEELVWETPQARGLSPDLDVRVLRVRWLQGDDGGLRAELEVVLGMGRRPDWDGVRAWHRRQVVHRRDVKVVVDGESLPVMEIEDQPGYFGARLDVPADGDRQVRGWVLVDTGSDRLPATLALSIKTAGGFVEVPIRPEVPLQPPSLGDWLAPRVAESRTVSALAYPLRTPTEVETLVQDLAVIPTTGVQRGPLAVWNRRGGSPLERALLARSLLQPLGHKSSVVCSDLDLGTAAEIYTASMPPLPDDMVRRVVESVRPQYDALLAPLAAQLDQLDVESDRERVRLVPEWCWLRLADGTDLDLRPDGYRDEALPPVWRTVDDLRKDLWKIDIVIEARNLTGVETDRGYAESVLIAYETDVGKLTQAGLVLDLFPDVTAPDRLRSQLVVVGADEAGGRSGAAVDRASLERVVGKISWTDPRGVAQLEDEVLLWSRDQDPQPPERVRAVFSADTGAVDGVEVERELRAALHGVAVAPAVSVILAQHALYAAVRRRLAGVERAEPSLLVSALARMQDGSVRRRLVEAAKSGPAFVGEEVDVRALKVRVAAADAAARVAVVSLHGDKAPLAAPSAWLWQQMPAFAAALGDAGELDQWQSRDIYHHVNHGRPIGIDPGGRLEPFWTWYADRGALADLGASQVIETWVTPESAPEGEPTGDPRDIHRRWRRPLVCRDMAMWATLMERAPPPACGLP